MRRGDSRAARRRGARQAWDSTDCCGSTCANSGYAHPGARSAKNFPSPFPKPRKNSKSGLDNPKHSRYPRNMLNMILTTRREPSASDRPSCVYYSCVTRALWAVGVPTTTRPKTNVLLLLLLSRVGCWVSRGEVIHALWGDDPNGGPDDVVGSLMQSLLLARPIAAKLGYSLLSNYGRGYGATPVEALAKMPTARYGRTA